MSAWYYADARNDRQGPVEASELARLRQQGAVTWQTLVWREGMANWQPMSDFADDFVQGDDRGPWLSTGSGSVVGHAAPSVADGASPYAPPTSPVDTVGHVVLGGEVVQAGFWKRFAAMIIDAFITAAASWAVQIPLFIMAGATGAMGGDLLSTGGSVGLFVLSYGVGILVPLLYFAWMHSSASQASLGKMAIGIKVTGGNGQRIGFWRAFLRYLAYLLLALFTLGIGAVVSAFTTGLTQRKQALHDMICDTLVVDKWAFTDRPDLQRRELGVVAWVAIIIGGGLVALALLAIVAAIAIPALYG
ncbi:MAG: RDD family protein [Luteimonas sp.]|nr:RDD family protein [Luteimonas sp.]